MHPDSEDSSALKNGSRFKMLKTYRDHEFLCCFQPWNNDPPNNRDWSRHVRLSYRQEVPAAPIYVELLLKYVGRIGEHETVDEYLLRRHGREPFVLWQLPL